MPDSWTTPKTMTSEVGTSFDWNTYVRDNQINLNRRTTMKYERISASESYSSGSYGNLATVGPTVTCTVGPSGLVLVCIAAAIVPPANQSACMAVALSGSQTLAAEDSNALAIAGPSGIAIRGSIVIPMTPEPGEVTFTAKYRTDGGAATFAERRLTVIPLGA